MNQETQANFKDYPLQLLKPSYDSPLTDILFELEHLRRVKLAVTTPEHIFKQIKRIFQMLESLGSARIEGNRTTVSDYLQMDQNSNALLASQKEELTEITNLEVALDYIDQTVTAGCEITEFFIKELQQITVQNLNKEGDLNSGSYRNHQVMISGSAHLPPDFMQVPNYMKELVDFINCEDPPKYDLIKVALVHHRFGWIHPFGNGNGRTVRLLTYALLLKYGFNIGDYDRLINPTAVFCCDREKYYSMLTIADQGTAEALEQWCQYVLDGLLNERKKLDIFLDFEEVKKKILRPTLSFAQKHGVLTTEELNILSFILENGEISNADISKHFKIKSNQTSYVLKKLRDRLLIVPSKEKKREYIFNMESRELRLGVIDAMHQADLIPKSLLKN